MASTINTSRQFLARSTLRAAAKASRTTSSKPRYYATTTNQDVPRSQEPEELSPTFNLDEISSMAHIELETHREMRELARRAAWEMPLLSKLSKPFQPPTMATPLRWRYTTYLGELHPAAQKVVVEFCLRDLQELTEEERQTVRKLAGPRWDPDTDILKMSCESFETQAQNKRYLAETIVALVREAREGADKFADVPLDRRHAVARAKRRHSRTPGIKFPDEWRMTPERRAALDAKAGRLPRLDTPAPAQIEASQGTPTQEQTFEAIKLAAMAAGDPQPRVPTTSTVSATGGVISGIDAIQIARRAASRRTEESVMAEARSTPPTGKMGRRDMAQQLGH